MSPFEVAPKICPSIYTSVFIKHVSEKGKEILKCGGKVSNSYFIITPIPLIISYYFEINPLYLILYTLNFT